MFCGVRVGDMECYKVFAEVFDPIIQEYHGIHSRDPIRHVTDRDCSKVTGIIDGDARIISTRIRVARNVDGFCLPPAIKRKNRVEFEDMMRNIFRNLDGDLAGSYHSLFEMNEKKKEKLINDHFLFQTPNKKTNISGVARDWPEGRGIFYNADKTFLVWVNEEDQLRLISMDTGLDVKGVFVRLVHGIDAIEKSLYKMFEREFSFSDKYGYITSCPTNLGTGMRASVLVSLPRWYEKGINNLKGRCEELNVQVRPCHGDIEMDGYSNVYVS